MSWYDTAFKHAANDPKVWLMSVTEDDALDAHQENAQGDCAADEPPRAPSPPTPVPRSPSSLDMGSIADGLPSPSSALLPSQKTEPKKRPMLTLPIRSRPLPTKMGGPVATHGLIGLQRVIDAPASSSNDSECCQSESVQYRKLRRNAIAGLLGSAPPYTPSHLSQDAEPHSHWDASAESDDNDLSSYANSLRIHQTGYKRKRKSLGDGKLRFASKRRQTPRARLRFRYPLMLRTMMDIIWESIPEHVWEKAAFAMRMREGTVSHDCTSCSCDPATRYDPACDAAFLRSRWYAMLTELMVKRI